MTFVAVGDAGHAGYGVTPGKRTPDGEYEWNFNDKVLRAFEKEINKYEGVKFVRSDDPTGRTDVSLGQRVRTSDNADADVFISFHHNANTGKWGTWTGTETYVYTTNPTKARKLAEAVHPEYVKAMGLRDRGIKLGNFQVIRETNAPAILLEGGYMDSTIDIEKLRNDKVLEAAGIAVAKGVAKYAGLKLKVVEAPTAVTKEPTKPAVKPAAKPKPTPSKPSASAVIPYPGKLIKSGSRGKNVEKIQRALGVKVDGIYGKNTVSAVKAYQKRHGLGVDGIVGKNTWNTIF